MPHKLTFNPKRITSFLGVATLALLANSCGHTEASPSRAPAGMDVVMKAIHSYGSGHAGLLSPGSSAKPDEPDELYSPRIKNLLVQEDFAQLEKIAHQNRIEKGRLLGGVWKTVGFYNGTGMPVFVGMPNDSDYADQIAREKRWIAANPDSTAARLSLAYLYLNYANLARGPGVADTVTDSQWGLFYDRTSQAKALLLEASVLKEKDPFWFHTMQLVAHNEGWDQHDARELFDEAVAFEPSYYHYYREYARYLLPEWYGNPGDVLAFAKETQKRVPEPNGSILYFRIVSALVCYCKPELEDLPKVDYLTFRRGYDNVSRFEGTADLNANRLAFMATIVRDKPSAREAFAAIKSMDKWTWQEEEVFNDAREWANSD